MSSIKTYDYMFKYIIVGDMCVGKSYTVDLVGESRFVRNLLDIF